MPLAVNPVLYDSRGAAPFTGIQLLVDLGIKGLPEDMLLVGGSGCMYIG